MTGEKSKICYLSHKQAVHELIDFIANDASIDDLALIISEYTRYEFVIVIGHDDFESVVAKDGYPEDEDDEEQTPRWQDDLFDEDFAEK